MDARTASLVVIATAAVASSLMIQWARRSLSSDQLFVLERVDLITIRSFVPVAPLLAALPLAYFPGADFTSVFSIACAFALTLFSLDLWRTRRRMLSVGLPRRYADVHAVARGIVIAGLVIAMFLIGRDMG